MRYLCSSLEVVMRVSRGASSFVGRRTAALAPVPSLYSGNKQIRKYTDWTGKIWKGSGASLGQVRKLRELPLLARAYSTGGSIEEIEFNPAAANTINIIGNVGRKPELKFLESGSKVTNFPIAFTDRKDGDTQWFDVEAWDELADIATTNIDKGERVALQGRLKVQDWTDREGNTRKSLRIVAQKIQRVRRTSMMMGGEAQPNFNQQNQKQVQTPPASSGSHEQSYQSLDLPMTNEELWMSFFENSSGWYDNREKKMNGEINPKSPDFKRIEGGRDAPALWIESKTTPAWVRTELAKLDQFQGDIPPF
jgi:single-strand DNA-binding protein